MGSRVFAVLEWLETNPVLVYFVYPTLAVMVGVIYLVVFFSWDRTQRQRKARLTPAEVVADNAERALLLARIAACLAAIAFIFALVALSRGR